MTDVERQFSDLAALSEVLNRESDGLNAQIKDFETRLFDLRLGISAWIGHEPVRRGTAAEADGAPTETATILGFAKTIEGWGLYLRTDILGDPSGPISQVRLRDAPREDRLAAVKLFPELLKVIKEGAERLVEEIRSTARAAAPSGAENKSRTEEGSVSGKKGANETAIEMFVGYFADQLRRIGSLKSHHYRKTLFVAVIDTLSRAAVPNLRDKNRERFLGFVDGWGDWPERGRVSLPQLMGNLAREKELAGGRLAAEVRLRLKAWQDGRIYHAADDPAKDELLAFAADDRERRLIEQHTHLSLLWVYRNMLVHGFREPGYDMGVLGEDATPYYMMQGEEGVSRWELAYPTTFFATLAERALANLKKHLQGSDLDPYAFYEFGSTWKQIVLKRP